MTTHVLRRIDRPSEPSIRPFFAHIHSGPGAESFGVLAEDARDAIHQALKIAFPDGEGVPSEGICISVLPAS